MNFLDDIINAASSAFDWFTGNSNMAALARTAALAFGVNKLSDSAFKSNDPGSQPQLQNTVDPGVRVQVAPSVDNRIPVLYGHAFVPGIISDAEMTADRQTMWYVITIAEKTGTLLSDGSESAYTFKDVYWNDQRVVFKTDGHTVDYSIDRDGNQDISMRDLVHVYFFAGDSTSPQLPEFYSGTPTWTAYDLVPSWTSSHEMNDLIFAVVRIDYSREKGVNQLGNLVFEIENSMEQPGDCLYDYSLNTRYGAGLSLEEIYSE